MKVFGLETELGGILMMNETKTWSDGEHKYTINDIAKLVLEIKKDRNNEHAMTALYQLFVNEIYRFFRNRVHSIFDVHDLTSETFVIMLKNIDKLERDHSFHSWLFGIALNLLRKYYKRKKRELEDMLDEGSADFQVYVSEAPATSLLPDTAVDQKYLRIYLSDIMSKMKKEQQLVLHLRFYEEMKVKEIAERMGKSEEAIKSLLFRSQRRLYKLLQKKFRTKVKNPFQPYSELLKSFADVS